MNEWDGKERRQHERIKEAFTIHHRLAGKNETWHISAIENVGAGGLLFNSPREYSEEDVLEIKIELRGLMEIFICRAIVRRVDEAGRAGIFSMAIEFTGLEEGRAQKLDDAIRNHREDK